MAWAKLHTDILGDRKLMRAAREGATGLHLLPWLIAFAKQADDDGRLTVGEEPANPVDIAETIPGVTPKMVGECLTSLTKIGVLVTDSDGKTLRLAAWERRSGTKPSDNPERIHARVKAHRERKSKEDNEAVTPRNALHHPRRNATEKKREREEQNRGDENPSPRKAAADTWVTPFADAWRSRFGGDLLIGKAVRPLAGLGATDPDARPEVLRRWGIYLAATTDGVYASAQKFAETYGQWEQPPPPKPNGNGNGNRPGIANRVFAKAEHALRDE